MNEGVKNTMLKFHKLIEEQNKVLRGSMAREYLPKDPANTLAEVKDKLNERISTLNSCIFKNKDEKDIIDRIMENEIDFLVELVEWIERT